MHENAGESLYITPICWTDDHARLLDVQFVDRDPILKPVPDFSSMSSKYPPRPSRIATDLTQDLTAILSPKATQFGSECIKQVMRTFFPATLSKAKSDEDLPLHFGDHVLKRAVRVAVSWKHPDNLGSSFDSAATRPSSPYGRIPSGSYESSGSQRSDRTIPSSQSTINQPILAYVNLAHLNMVRRNLYRVMPGPVDGDRWNTPVSNLQRLRSKRLVPASKGHDSYVVAVMLAIAQSQCYPARCSVSFSKSTSQGLAWGSAAETVSRQPIFKDVPIKILSHDNDTSEFVIYSAVLTACFIKRFANPSRAPDANDISNGGLKVEITRVPIWPVLGLKERLAKALGAEISGEACLQLPDTEIETWEPEYKIQLGSLKRSREVLSEVFNRSFDSDSGGSPVRAPSTSTSVDAGLGITVGSPPRSPRTPKRRRTQSISELEVC